MGLKFLNKKGWHTGSLRNIENVWKAEQKRDAEDKKLEELRKQIHEERERSEFRLLQEQAGLIPKQERLDFLYDSGLAVGKASSSDGFKALEPLPKTEAEIPSSSSTKAQAQQPGALFEEKPQSANDAWRKLHSDPLLLIRQREQEALARVKNNPVQMAMIRKSVEAKKHKQKTSNEEERKKEKHHHKKSKHHKHTSSGRHNDPENTISPKDGERKRDSRRSSKYEEKHLRKADSNSDASSDDEDIRREKDTRNSRRSSKYEDKHIRKEAPNSDVSSDGEDVRREKNTRNPRQSSKYDEKHLRKVTPHSDVSSDEENIRREKNTRDSGRSSKYEEKHSRKEAPISNVSSDEEDIRREKYARDSRRSSKYDERHLRKATPHSDVSGDEENIRRDKNSRDSSRSSKYEDKHLRKEPPNSGIASDEEDIRREKNTRDSRRSSKYDDRHLRKSAPKSGGSSDEEDVRRGKNSNKELKYKEKQSPPRGSHEQGLALPLPPPLPPNHQHLKKIRNTKLSEEERAARLREMQMDAELHEEQRWKRLKKADEDDAREASTMSSSGRGKNFLDAVHRSVYGAEKGGSATIEESVRRRTHYSQGRSQVGQGNNAFRR